MAARKTRPAPRPARRRGTRKDRLIQTRVPRDLETALKDEARRRRLTVSHLIRNVLEDTFRLVNGVVEDVDQIVGDSVELAQNVGRRARRIAAHARSRDEARARADTSSLSSIDAWTPVVMNRSATCAKCEARLRKGQRAYAGVNETPSGARRWLCPACLESL